MMRSPLVKIAQLMKNSDKSNTTSVCDFIRRIFTGAELRWSTLWRGESAGDPSLRSEHSWPDRTLCFGKWRSTRSDGQTW